MLDKTLLAVSLSLALASPGLAQDARTVVLREYLVTDDHIISASDLFVGVDDTTPLARAGSPGQIVSLDPVYIQREVAQLGLSWANASNVERISIRRASIEIPQSLISDLIASELYARTGHSHEVSLSSAAASIHKPVDAAGSAELITLDIEVSGGAFRANIRPYQDAEPIQITGRAESVMDVPVLTRPIARGDVISASDIEWIRLRSDRVRAETIVDVAGLEGQQARRALRPGEALKDFDLVAPTMIERGETIALVYQSGSLILTAQARALSDAAEGERINFINLQSNRTVEAVAVAPGEARVGFVTTAS